MPRDVLQESAAQELYNRNWRFHKELKVWLSKEAGSETLAKTATFERGVFTVFEQETWVKTSKELVVVYENLEERSMATAE